MLQDIKADTLATRRIYFLEQGMSRVKTMEHALVKMQGQMNHVKFTYWEQNVIGRKKQNNINMR